MTRAEAKVVLDVVESVLLCDPTLLLTPVARRDLATVARRAVARRIAPHVIETTEHVNVRSASRAPVARVERGHRARPPDEEKP
jgi:hypothetical protein